jgi:hypothetical protein
MESGKLRIPALLITAAAVITSLVVIGSTVAQTNQNAAGLEVSPPSQEIDGDPGETVTVTAKVRNRGTETRNIEVRIEDFTAQGDEGQIALTEKGPDSVSAWTTLDPRSFDLAPGQEREVTATVKIPASGAVGGQYGSFVFGAVPESANPNEAAVGQEVASLFLVRVGGEVNEQLAFTRFEAPGFSETGPVTMNMTFTNGGNVHVKPYGIVSVSDMFGNKVKDIVVPGANILPGASRIIPVTLDKRFLLGSYKATAVMYYGTSETDTLTAEASFAVVPYKLLAVVAVIAFIAFKMRKRLKKASRAIFGK